jgi:hypothetical protein
MAAVTPLKQKPALRSPQRSAERSALAEAVARRDELTKKLDAIERAQAATKVTITRLHECIDQADVDIAEAKRMLASRAVAKALGEDMPEGDDLAALRAQQTELRDQLDVAQETGKGLEQQRKAVSASLQLAQSSVRAKVADVTKADPSLRKLVEDFLIAERRLAEQRQVLEFLGFEHLPEDLKFAATTKVRVQADAAVAVWQQALAALAQEADSALPSNQD